MRVHARPDFGTLRGRRGIRGSRGRLGRRRSGVRAIVPLPGGARGAEGILKGRALAPVDEFRWRRAKRRAVRDGLVRVAERLMSVTIHLNGKSLSLAHKGCSGLTKSTLPDVCKTPSPGGPVPVPYPI